MATATRHHEHPASERTGARRIVRAVSHGPVNVFLTVVALLWLVPTVGLFFASLRDAADNGTSGWWTAILRPAQLTLQSYKHVLENPDMVRAFWNTVLITLPASILVVVRGGPRRVRVRVDPVPGSRLHLPGGRGAARRAAADRPDPRRPALRHHGLFGTIPGVVLFHVAFGLPFAIFLLRNFFIGIP